MSDSKEKLRELEDNFRKQSGDVGLAVSLAEEHLGANNVNRAREVLDKFIKSNQDAGEALLLRSEILAEQHDWVGAKRDAKSAKKAGVKVPNKHYLRTVYFSWLVLSVEGWRPNKLSRIMTFVMSVSIGLLVTAMGIRLLIEGAYIGFLFSLVLGIGFFWGGLVVGGVPLWLRSLQDKINPDWNKAPEKKKKKK